MRLIVENSREERATIPISWKVDVKVIEKLKKEKVELNRVYVLLSVIYKGREVDRFLSHFEQGTEYVNFYRSGKHTVCGVILVRNNFEGSSWFESMLHLRECDSSYSYKLWWDDAFIPHRLNQSLDRVGRGYVLSMAENEFEADKTDIEISKQFFAPEPWPWVKRWTNWWYETPARDQCQFRRRKIFAFTLQPILALIYVICKVFASSLSVFFLAMAGKRGINFKPIIHPINYKISDVWGDLGSSVFLRKKDGTERHAAIAFFCPLLYLVATSVTILTFAVYYWTLDFRHPLEYAWNNDKVLMISFCFLFQILGFLLAALNVVISLTIFVLRPLMKIFAYVALPFILILGFVGLSKKPLRLLTWPFVSIGKFLKYIFVDRRIQKMEEWERSLPKRYDKVFEGLVNVEGQSQVIVSAPSRKTFYLWFKDIKSRVCKPFARS